MNIIPTIVTERLVLRPFTLGDAPTVQSLAGSREIADTTLNIPHPYPDGAAEKWITAHQDIYETTGSISWAITMNDSGEIIGCISLVVDRKYERAELGYWIAKSHWGQGYCTEAAKAVLSYGFRQINLNRVYAFYLSRNPASGKVMQKIGMRKEGEMRQHIKKWNCYEDLQYYGILNSEYKP